MSEGDISDKDKCLAMQGIKFMKEGMIRLEA